MTKITPEEGADSECASTSRYRHAATAFIALAFAGSLAAKTSTGGTAYRLGEGFGQTLAALALFSGIAWLINRGRSDLAKARGRLVVSLLLCITVLGSFVTDTRERRVAEEFMRSAMAIGAKQESEFVALGARFERVTLAPYVTPQALTSRASIAAARAAVDQYRALLDERVALLDAQATESRAFVSHVASADLRRGAEATMEPTIESTRKVHLGLDAAQRVHADALGALFNWAHANMGRLSLSGGVLVFQTRQQQAELAALAATLQDAERHVEAAMKVAQTELAKATERRQEALRQGQAFLAR